MNSCYHQINKKPKRINTSKTYFIDFDSPKYNKNEM